MAAIREVFASGEPLEREAAVREVAHALGFHRAGSRVRWAVLQSRRVAVNRGIVRREGDWFYLGCRSIGDYSRDQLIEALLGAMNYSWQERDEAMRAAARYLGFRRAGSAIRDAFKPAINGAIRRGLVEYGGSLIRRARWWIGAGLNTRFSQFPLKCESVEAQQ